MKTGDILALLGHESTDEAIEALFAELGVRRRPELDDDEEEICAWIPVRRLGIEFGFEDEGHFKALDRPIGTGPFLLTQVLFYNEREDIRPYSGKLPHGLDFKNSRGTVRMKLQLYDKFRRSYIRDVWEIPEYRLIVDYTDGGQSISSVICQSRRYPSPPGSEPAPRLPSIDDLIGLFGLGPMDPVFLSTFSPLGISEHKDELNDDWEADFRDQYGLEVRFDETKCGNPKASKKLGMTSASLYADRAFDARAGRAGCPAICSFLSGMASSIGYSAFEFAEGACAAPSIGLRKIPYARLRQIPVSRYHSNPACPNGAVHGGNHGPRNPFHSPHAGHSRGARSAFHHNTPDEQADPRKEARC